MPTTININYDKFAQIEGYCIGRFHYQMGGKCSNLGDFPPMFELNGAPCNGVDCSGFVRMLLHRSADGVAKSMPDGSYIEDNWFAAQGFQRVAYSECANNDQKVRVAIHRPNGRGGDPTGHIWLCVHGHTVESHGGVGPSQRAWNDKLLISLVDDCFVLGPLV